MKEQCKAVIVENFAEQGIFTVSTNWIMTDEYSYNGMTVRDFLYTVDDKRCSVVEINGELYATDD